MVQMTSWVLKGFGLESARVLTTRSRTQGEKDLKKKKNGLMLYRRLASISRQSCFNFLSVGIALNLETRVSTECH